MIELKKETTKEAVCLVFEKVNTGGVQLSVLELVTASYAADGFNLRRDWFGEGSTRVVCGLLAGKPLLKDTAETDFLQGVILLHTHERQQADLKAGKTGKEVTGVRPSVSTSWRCRWTPTGNGLTTLRRGSLRRTSSSGTSASTTRTSCPTVPN